MRKKTVSVDLRHRFRSNVILAVADESDEVSDEGFKEISYNEIYGSLEQKSSTRNEISLSSIDQSSFIGSPIPAVLGLPVSSTPLRENVFCLDPFEPGEEDSDISCESLDCPLVALQEVELFDGSNNSTNDFFSGFKMISNQFSFSDIARRELLKFFASFLPQPNNVFSPIPKEHLPNTTIFQKTTQFLLL